MIIYKTYGYDIELWSINFTQIRYRNLLIHIYFYSTLIYFYYPICYWLQHILSSCKILTSASILSWILLWDYASTSQELFLAPAHLVNMVMGESREVAARRWKRTQPPHWRLLWVTYSKFSNYDMENYYVRPEARVMCFYLWFIWSDVNCWKY